MFQFEHLDEHTRALMLSEVARDHEAKSLFFDTRLKGEMHSPYLDSLRRALAGGSPESFAAEIEAGAYLNVTEMRKQGGKEVGARIPVTYPQTLAEAEFNRYYMRAVCLRGLGAGKSIEVYRAKPVTTPRPIEATDWTAESLLAHLRETNISVPGAFPGANSGKSVRLVG